ncbi:MAG: hypothetical protein KIT84_24490 [Labilithrix sp.]|nr:hypothetical protein [Labilithrix sp.]MCW5814208.1 hypothetical protein [Labilithrix sp.]
MTARVEIFRAGPQTASNGEVVDLSTADLDAAALAYEPRLREAPIVIGHPHDDTPTYGRVESLERSGNVLVAEVGRLNHDFVEAVREGRYTKVSASFFTPDAFANPHPGRWYLKHVGFLGAAAPAVKGLRAVAFVEDGAPSFVEAVHAVGADLRAFGIFLRRFAPTAYFVEERLLPREGASAQGWRAPIVVPPSKMANQPFAIVVPELGDDGTVYDRFIEADAVDAVPVRAGKAYGNENPELDHDRIERQAQLYQVAQRLKGIDIRIEDAVEHVTDVALASERYRKKARAAGRDVSPAEAYGYVVRLLGKDWATVRDFTADDELGAETVAAASSLFIADLRRHDVFVSTSQAVRTTEQFLRRAGSLGGAMIREAVAGTRLGALRFR